MEFSNLPYFNSIKVRLEHKMREYSNFYAALFQFHKGAIRTLIASEYAKARM